MWKAVAKTAGAIGLALISAVFGAMLTTSYKALRANGESYLPALSVGIQTLGKAFVGLVTSPWVLIPVGAVVLVLLTVKLTIRAMRPKANHHKQLGVRMDQYARAAAYDQRNRRFTTLYQGTMRVCHEIEAFIVEVSQQGIPVPSPQSNRAEEWIDICCDYFTAVGPYLRNGNLTYAIGAAQGFADRFPSRPG